MPTVLPANKSHTILQMPWGQLFNVGVPVLEEIISVEHIDIAGRVYNTTVCFRGQEQTRFSSHNGREGLVQF